MHKDRQAITFKALFYKASTTVDGGWRLYLDLGAHDSEVISELALTTGRSLACAIVVESEGEGSGKEEADDFGPKFSFDF